MFFNGPGPQGCYLHKCFDNFFPALSETERLDKTWVEQLPRLDKFFFLGEWALDMENALRIFQNGNISLPARNSNGLFKNFSLWGHGGILNGEMCCPLRLIPQEFLILMLVYTQPLAIHQNYHFFPPSQFMITVASPPDKLISSWFCLYLVPVFTVTIHWWV